MTTTHTPTPYARTFTAYERDQATIAELRADIARKNAKGREAIDCIESQAATIAELVAALREILIDSDMTMAKGSRDILDWQDDNRRIGDAARAALAKVAK